MTQWWRLLYDAGSHSITRWLRDVERHDGYWSGVDHTGHERYWSEASPWMLTEQDELPPKRADEVDAVGMDTKAVLLDG